MPKNPQQHISKQYRNASKNTTHHDQLGFTTRMQVWYNIYKSIHVIQHITNWRIKIISISADANKKFHKVQHSFIIKSLSKMWIEWTYQNIIKAIYDKPTVSIILNWQKLKVLPLRLGTRQGCMFSLLLFNILLKALDIAIRQQKEIKGIQIGQDELKLSLFVNDMTLYMEKPNDSTKKLLQLMNKFSKVAGYKINI